MKITFVMPGPAGGGARMVARFATGLIEKGHDVCILYPHPERNLKSILRSAWINIRYQKRGDWLHSFPGVVQPYNCLTPELVSHNDFLIGVGVDCVLAIAELPRECGIKINNSHGRELWIKERMLRAWHFPMPRIVVTSHLEQEMQDYGCKDEIFVVHYGIDRTDYYPSNPDGKLTGVGTVYHGGSVKDPETIFKVFRIIHERRPEIPLIIFGGFPRPQGLPDAAQYTRLPAMPMVRELYSQAKVWFCASRSEGFGLPLIEAIPPTMTIVNTKIISLNAKELGSINDM